jgi:spermidine synthase
VTIAFGEDAGRRVLLVDGTVQSLAGPLVRFEKDGGYWAAMVPDRRPSRTLLLGLGVGTVARYLHARFGPLPLVGIDDDPSVVAAARQELADLDDLEIVAADAFEWVAAARPRERFDLICVDLYRGAQIQAQIVGRPFLRRLRELLAPRSDVVFNLFADRRTAARGHRIGRVFQITRTIPVGKNLVVWCR